MNRLPTTAADVFLVTMPHSYGLAMMLGGSFAADCSLQHVADSSTCCLVLLQAIITDAAHMLSDVLSFAIVLIAGCECCCASCHKYAW
jgi:hypothetical protein